jgi:3-methyladenine DNA glycosylase AlkD
MRAYMKSDMPFHGVPAPERRAIEHRSFGGVAFDSHREWRTTIRYLWEHAQFREERYLVISLVRAKASERFRTPTALPTLGHLIASGAWWDYVDEIAVHCVGPVLRSHPVETRRVLARWSRSTDLWKRRATILSQVGSKEATDPTLLAEWIAPSLSSREFFLRKGIGWALRQYARTDPDWVRRYVRANARTLSPLSRREALRHLTPGG